MPVEENKVLLRRYIEEVLNQGNVDAVDKLFAADCVTTLRLPFLTTQNPKGLSPLDHKGG